MPQRPQRSNITTNRGFRHAEFPRHACLYAMPYIVSPQQLHHFLAAQHGTIAPQGVIRPPSRRTPTHLIPRR